MLVKWCTQHASNFGKLSSGKDTRDVQAGFTKGRGIRDQIANIRWITQKAREFLKDICFIDYAKVFYHVLLLLLSHFSRVQLGATP